MTIRRWFRILLPVLWLLSAMVSEQHPGDEYGLWGVACLPAVWLVLVMPRANPIKLLPLVYAAGMLSTGLIGWALDRLQVRRLVWMAMWSTGVIALVWAAMYQYESYQRAIARNGSLTAYDSAASSLSLVLTSAACICGGLFWRGVQVVRSKLRSSDV